MLKRKQEEEEEEKFHARKSNFSIVVPFKYRSPNIVRDIKSRRSRWAGHVARMEEGRCAFKILTGKPTGKRPLGRPRRRWENILEFILKK